VDELNLERKGLMKRFAFGLACVLAMAPGVASAALSITIGPDIEAPGGSVEHFVDLVFSETGPATNEGLFAYDLYITRDKPGINLIRAEKPDNWVFTSPGASFQEAGPEFSNKPGLIVVNAIGDLLGANQDIQNGTKVARVFYTIDQDAAPGIYHLSLDPAGTLFVSGDTGEAIPVDLSDPGTVVVWPEPTAMPLLAVGGVLAVRRRRA
jgi:hypothetical protein